VLHQEIDDFGLDLRVGRACMLTRHGVRIAIYDQEAGGGILPGQALQGQTPEFPTP
jgi:hypothetical protein